MRARFQRLLWALYGRLVNKGSRLLDVVACKGIVVFVGPNGAGKSLLAVETLLPTLAGIAWECSDLAHVHNRELALHVADCSDCSKLAAGWRFCEEGTDLLDVCGHGERLVWSTLPILDDSTGLEHRLYRPLTHIRDLVGIEHADVFMDEVAGVSDASDSATMPAGMTRWLQQLRKRDVLLRVTTPAYDRCSKPIRQVATLVVDLRAFFEEPSESGRLWRPRRAMIAKAYDAFAFGNFNKNSGDRLGCMASLAYWRPTGRAQNCYDTLAQVHALVDVTEGGTCTTCNGSRTRAKCDCDPSLVESLLPGETVEIVEETTARGGRVRRAVRVSGDSDPAGPRRGAGTEVPGLELLTVGSHRAESSPIT